MNDPDDIYLVPPKITVNRVRPDGTLECTITCTTLAYLETIKVSYTMMKRPWWSALIVRAWYAIFKEKPAPRWLP